MERPFLIALYARRFALLARRPELLSSDASNRIAHAIGDIAPGPLHLLDAAQVAGSTELDRLCAFAVSVLAQADGRSKVTLLDALGILDPDRIVAMYYALPEERRETVRRDPAWGFHVQQVEREMPEAIEAIEELIASTPTTPLALALAEMAWSDEMAEYAAARGVS